MIRKLYYLLSFLLICPLLMHAQPNHNKKVIGYYAQWAIYARDFNVSKIDGNKLTHLMYAFFGTEFDPANPQSAKIKSLDTYADFEHTEGGAPWNAVPKGNFYDLMQLKQTYPHLKILISIGGWTKSQDLPGIAASPVARTAFAQDMANFLTTYPFIDGFDIDWEFPIIGGIDGTEVIGGITPPAQPHTPNDHKNLVYLLKEMRLAMPNKLISIAAGNSVVNVPNQFIGPGNKAQFGMTDDITTYCDFITFFGYDLGGNWYDKTCYNAPLYGSGNANDPLNANNESLDHLTNIYLNTLGIPSNKLVMGIPFYGKMFNSVANNGTIPSLPGLFVSAPRTTGSCVNPQAPQGTWDNGFCEFTGSIEFCDIAGNSGTTGHHYLNPANPENLLPASAGAGWVRYWDNTAKVPYLYNATTHQFITYDDKKSIDEKAKFINLKNLGGAMIWELSQDTRPGSPEPAALLGQINTTFSGVTPPPPTIVTVKLTFKDQLNNAISGVSTVLTKTSDNSTVDAVSDTNGIVQFPNTATNLAYTLSYSKNSFAFSPQTIAIASGSLTSDVTYNVTGSTQSNVTYTISGSVKNGTTALSGITVTLTNNGVASTTTTNSSGNYSFANLVPNQNYSVAASNSGQTFLPALASFTNLSANQTQDFTLQVTNSIYLISGTVKDGTIPVAGAKVDLVLPWTDNTHNWVNLSTLTDAQGNYHFENAALSGYNTYLSLKLNAWENNDVTYLPSYPQANLPTTPQTFNFNTQSVVATAPVVTIAAPTSPTVSLNLGEAINFVANVGLSNNDGTTISSVVFSLDGQNLSSTNSSSNYNASWTPVANQFSGNHVLTVTATASNGTIDTETYNFVLTCSGSNCPNQLPVITWISPSNTTINQNSFQVVPISVTATDTDGSILGVTITINGSTHAMIAGVNGTFTYNFMPTAYQAYPVVISATDNLQAISSLNKTIAISNISNNRFIPLPSKVVLGYAHSWENAEATFMYFNQMVGSKFNVVAYAFVETVNRDGYTPVLTTNDNRYLSNGVFDKQLLKNDIQTLRNSGVPVIVSIGGQNGHVVLQTVAQKNIFVNGLKSIIDEYQFDGVDIDFEGGSMDFGAAGLTDFSYNGISAYPRLKNIVDAFKELKQFYGPGFILTSAPETFYVQVGYQSYGGTAGSFLPVLHNLRNELDLLMVQLYNSGPVGGLDNQNYFSATPNFITSMTDMLMKGFNVGTTGFHFDALPPSKVIVGLPACQRAAGTGYLSPNEGIKALNYLRFGTDFSGRTYTMQSGGPYPDLRGVMTWSVNWDAATSCASAYEFSNGYGSYFLASPIVSNTTNRAKENSAKGFLYDSKLKVETKNSLIQQVRVYNLFGQLVVSQNYNGTDNKVEISHDSFTNKQVYVVKIIDNEGIVTEVKVY